MRIALIILVVGGSIAVSAKRAYAAEPTGYVFSVPSSYLTGYEYRRNGEAVREGYVMGLFDGLLASPIFGASQRALQSLSSCVGKIDATQLRAMFDRYVDSHPEEWNLVASAIFYNLFNSACPYLRKGIEHRE